MIIKSPCIIAPPGYVESQLHEPHQIEDNPESEDFAQILAGLLTKNEKDLTDVPKVDLSGIKIDSGGLNESDLLHIQAAALMPAENEMNTGELIPSAGLEQIETNQIKTDVPMEHINSVLSVIHVDDSNMQAFNDPVPGGEAANILSEKQRFSNHNPGNTDRVNIDKAGLIRVREIAEEALAAEKTAKNNIHNIKDNDLPKNLKAEPASENKLRNTLEGNEAKLSVMQNEHGKEPRGRLDELRNRSRRDRLSLDVRDYRTGADLQNNSQRFASVETSPRVQDMSGREISLELRLPEHVNNTAQTAWEGRSSTALENMLARELHQNFNGDIVRHASMALRNGGEGIIKLALKPESLGNVKIHLIMSENKITGHIVVESEEALNAFRKEIASLERAFMESGFAGASLDLSMAGGNSRRNDLEENSFIPRMIASRYDTPFEQETFLIDIFSGHGQNTINLFA